MHGCPPWVLLLTGFAVGSMTKQSLRRLLKIAGRDGGLSQSR